MPEQCPLHPYDEICSFFSSFLGGLEKGVVPMSSMFAEKRVVFWGAFDSRRTARVVRAPRASVEASGTGPNYR